MLIIAERLQQLVKQFPQTEFVEFEVVNQLTDELLSEMGEIEQYDNVKKALVNMFFVGHLLNNTENGK